MSKFLVDGATLKCTLGAKPASLSVSPSKVKGCGSPMANELDGAPLVNIPSFGVCKLTSPPTPCVPGTCVWNTSSNVKIRGAASVDDSCDIMCARGGKISVQSAGQSKINHT